MSSHTSEWNEIVEADDLSKAIQLHLDKFGIRPENRKYIDALSKHASKAVIEEAQLKIEFKNEEDVFIYLLLAAPFTGPINVGLPDSMIAFYRIHNGLYLVEDEDASLEICYLNNEGEVEESSSWCYYFVDDAKANKDLISRLHSEGRDSKSILNFGSYDRGANWYLLHPFTKNSAGENSIVDFDHGTCNMADVSDDAFPDFLVKKLCQTLDIIV